MTNALMKKFRFSLITDRYILGGRRRYRRRTNQLNNTNERTARTRVSRIHRTLQDIDRCILLMNIFAPYVKGLARIYRRDGIILEGFIQKNTEVTKIITTL